MKLEGERLQRPRDWGTMREIVEGHRMRMWEAEEVYKIEYNTRVEVRLRKLVDRQGQKKRDHLHSHGMLDRFSPQDLLKQAQRDVRHDHEKHLARLRRQREQDMRGFLSKVRRKNAMQDKAKDSFNRAVDRRNGSQRRSSDQEPAAQPRASPKPRMRRRD
ncbi:MAG: hypothetical protein AAGH60_02720 [Pseudomonadota bacterium]